MTNTNVIDIFNPQVSVVAKGLEGKILTYYGGNNLGKSFQASRMKNVLYFPLEKGLGAIPGVKYMPVNKWSEFVKYTKQLEKAGDKAKEMYSTIVIDSLDAFAKYANKFVCSKYGVERLKDGNDGFGLWTEYATEVWEAVDRLVSLGMTIVFIAHAQEDKQGKIRPKGDARTISPILDASDLVMFLASNGVDEEGKVIKSSGYLAETDQYFARSRFTYIDTIIPEFTAENLEKAVALAIERQEQAEGITAVTYDEQKEKNASEDIDFNTLKNNTTELLNGLANTEGADVQSLVELVEKHLGKNAKVSEARPMQQEAVQVLYDDLLEIKNNQ